MVAAKCKRSDCLVMHTSCRVVFSKLYENISIFNSLHYFGFVLHFRMTIICILVLSDSHLSLISPIVHR
jgi:hypothetical protein